MNLRFFISGGWRGWQGPLKAVVPVGSLTIGSPSSEEGRSDDEGPLHHVTIGAPFAIGGS